MKRQDVSGQNTLHVDGGGGSGSDVNIASVGGTPVTDPLPVSIASVPGNVTVVQPTGTNLHVVTDTTSTTIATQATGTNLHTVVDSGTVAISAGAAVIGHVITDTGSTTAVTGNVTVVQPTGSNLHAVLDSGTTTVTQGTGTNLHTVVDSGSITANAGTNLNTSALALDASVTALKPALSVTFLQVTASGDTTLLASATRKIHRVEMSNSHATTALTAGLKVASLNSGAVFAKKYLPAAGGLGVTTFGQGYLQTTSETTVVNLSTAGTIEVTIYYE